MDNLLNKQMLIRRVVLIMTLVCVVYTIYHVMQPEVIINIGPSGAAVVSAILALLGVSVKFYNDSRN